MLPVRALSSGCVVNTVSATDPSSASPWTIRLRSVEVTAAIASELLTTRLPIAGRGSRRESHHPAGAAARRAGEPSGRAAGALGRSSIRPIVTCTTVSTGGCAPRPSRRDGGAGRLDSCESRAGIGARGFGMRGDAPGRPAGRRPTGAAACALRPGVDRPRRAAGAVRWRGESPWGVALPAGRPWRCRRRADVARRRPPRDPRRGRRRGRGASPAGSVSAGAAPGPGRRRRWDAAALPWRRPERPASAAPGRRSGAGLGGDPVAGVQPPSGSGSSSRKRIRLWITASASRMVSRGARGSNREATRGRRPEVAPTARAARLVRRSPTAYASASSAYTTRRRGLKRSTSDSVQPYARASVSTW